MEEYEEPLVAHIPTQVTEPGQAVKRTTVQTLLASLLTLLVILPAAILVFAEELQKYLPEAWYAWLLGAAGLLSALSAAFTKIMTIPKVDLLLSKIGLSASKEG